MLRRGLRTRFGGLACSGPQLGDARDRGVVVQALIDEKAAHHSAGPALTTPTVKVNDSAAIDFASDASQYPVISSLVEDIHIWNGMGEVTDLDTGALARSTQCLTVWL